MSRLHVTIVAALLALAAVLGGVAVARTTGLGAASRASTDAAVAAKEKQLAAFQRQLARALAARTPALPRVPKVAKAPARPVQRVVYHRPPPIVVVRHTHHEDDGHEGGGDD